MWQQILGLLDTLDSEEIWPLLNCYAPATEGALASLAMG